MVSCQLSDRLSIRDRHRAGGLGRRRVPNAPLPVLGDRHAEPFLDLPGQRPSAEHCEHRQRPDHQHHEKHDGRGDRDLDERFVGLAQISEDEPQMQSDVGEDERFEQDIDGVPDVPLLQTGLVTGVECSAADDEARDDDSQYPGRMQMLSGDERGERHQQPLHGFQPRVGQPPADPQGDVTQRRSDEGSHHGAVAEQQQRILDERVAAGDVCHRDREQTQRSRIVDQALAGQDRHHPFGQAELAAHRDCGHRVRRGDDGAQHQCRGEGQRNHHQPGRHRSDGEGGDHHECDAEAEDRPDVAQERREREIQRRRIQQRRQHDGQQDVRVQFRRFETRQERHRATDDDDDERRFQSAPVGNGGHHDRADDNEDQFHPQIVASNL